MCPSLLWFLHYLLPFSNLAHHQPRVASAHLSRTRGDSEGVQQRWRGQWVRRVGRVCWHVTAILYRLNNVPSVRVAHCSLSSNTQSWECPSQVSTLLLIKLFEGWDHRFLSWGCIDIRMILQVNLFHKTYNSFTPGEGVVMFVQYRVQARIWYRCSGFFLCACVTRSADAFPKQVI